MEASPRPLEGPPSRLPWYMLLSTNSVSLSIAARMEISPLPFRLNYEPFMPTSAHPLRSVRSQPHTIP